jgi:hypothetical protein
MNGLESLDGAEGIISVGVMISGWSIYLDFNPILTSTIALANTKYPTDKLYITGNTKLEFVPCAWPATDGNRNPIPPHDSCPPAPTPTPGSIGSTGGDMLVVIAMVIVALACAAGFVYYRRRASAAHNKDDPLQKSLLDGDELEMGSLGTAAEGMAPKDAVLRTGFVRTPISHLGSSISTASNVSALQGHESETRQSFQNKSELTVEAAAAPAITQLRTSDAVGQIKQSATVGYQAETTLASNAVEQTKQSATSNIGKYHIGQEVEAPFRGTVVRITPNEAGAVSGPGVLDIRTAGDAAVAAITVLDQVETFRIRLGFQIALRQGPGSAVKTGGMLLQGSMFEVDQKAPSTTDNQVFLHAVDAGWVGQYHPQSGKPICERAWSTDRSEVDFDMLKHATNGFEASQEIGDGGSCTVYRATVDGIPCAIKVLAVDAAGWEAEQFAAEVNLLRRVHHPNLCRLYASSTNGPSKCLVLELMEGGALDNRLVAQPRLGWQQRVSIALDTCRGLVYLHSLSPPMIHRDVSACCKCVARDLKFEFSLQLMFTAPSATPLPHVLPFSTPTRSRAKTSCWSVTRVTSSTKIRQPKWQTLVLSVSTTAIRIKMVFFARPLRPMRPRKGWLAPLLTCPLR